MNPAALLRWGVRVAFGLALVLLLCAAAVWVAQRPLFDIRHIEVHGTSGELQHVSAAAVRAALRAAARPAVRADRAPALRGNYFTLRLEEARRVFETIPWVASASVRRAWPDRLIVTLTEHRALGTWGDGRLLSDAGVLFVANAAEAEIDRELPEFDGPDRLAGEMARRFYEIAGLLAPLDLSIESIEVSERASWTVRTDTGQTLELGRDEPAGRLRERLTAIAASYAHVAARVSGPPTRIDARYPNGFAVAFHGATAIGANSKKP